MQRMFGWTRIDASDKRNANPGGTSSAARELGQWEGKGGQAERDRRAALMAQVRERNALDLELYAYATRLFERQAAALNVTKRAGGMGEEGEDGLL